MAFPKDDRAPAPARPAQRKPFGALEQRMVAPLREGYRRYWFNDEPGRITRAQEAGYAHVTEDGKPIQRVVGRSKDNPGGLIAFLMEIPQAWYEEDMDSQQAERDAKMREIREGQLGAQSGDNRYVPQQGISVTQSNRR